MVLTKLVKIIPNETWNQITTYTKQKKHGNQWHLKKNGDILKNIKNFGLKFSFKMDAINFTFFLQSNF